MTIRIGGGAWITAAGHGRLNENQPVAWAAGEIAIPPARGLFAHPPARWGRFDAYTRLGCAAVALALADAGLSNPRAPQTEPSPVSHQSLASSAVGLVSESALDCFATDVEYYATARGAGGSLASPSLFTYTVPGVMLGECAVLFGLTGPTLCIGPSPGDVNGRGLSALRTACRLLEGGMAGAVVAGWIECCPPEAAGLTPAEAPRGGAIYLVLTAESYANDAAQARAGAVAGRYAIEMNHSQIVDTAGREIQSLEELFRSFDHL